MLTCNLNHRPLNPPLPSPPPNPQVTLFLTLSFAVTSTLLLQPGLQPPTLCLCCIYPQHATPHPRLDILLTSPWALETWGLHLCCAKILPSERFIRWAQNTGWMHAVYVCINACLFVYVHAYLFTCMHVTQLLYILSYNCLWLIHHMQWRVGDQSLPAWACFPGRGASRRCHYCSQRQCGMARKPFYVNITPLFLVRVLIISYEMLYYDRQCFFVQIS